MKILIVSLFLPQAKAYHAGGRYVYEILKYLSERHEIYLCTRLEENEILYLDTLKPLCKEIYPYIYRTAAKRGILEIIRLLFNYIRFSRYANKLVHNGHFDIIQVEWVEAALMIKKRNTPMVLDAHDVITKPSERLTKQKRGLWRFVSYLKYLCIKALELRIMQRFDTIFTLSDYDRKYLLNLQPGLKIQTVPIPAGLDLTDRTFERDKNTILFLASYKYRRVNVDAALWFYRLVFPLVRKVVPDVRFIVAGYGPPKELTSLQEKDHAVSVPGFVEDIDRCYKKAAVFVAPILVGGGIIVKILDAMAAGTPVVTTSYGNEGIEAVHGRDLLVADNPESFASAVINVLRDDQLAEKLGRNGREFVMQKYSLRATLDKIEATYNELLKSSPTQQDPISISKKQIYF